MRIRLLAIACVVTAVACTSEDATPIDPNSPPVSATEPAVATPHLLEPTDQMRELATEQCLDDPDLAQGEVNAVDPVNPDQILSSVVVDCEDVRP